MQIRKMLLSDYFNVYHLWLNTPGIGLNTKDDSEMGIEKYLRRNPNTCFVAEKEVEIIGVILSGHDGRRGLIYHLAVKFSEREQGVGNTLLEHALEALRNEGIQKVYIMVFKNNEPETPFGKSEVFPFPMNLSIGQKRLFRLNILIYESKPPRLVVASQII